jgi:hypothetical protein
VSGIDLAKVVAKLEDPGRTVSIIGTDHADLSSIPEQWRAIAGSDDAEERRLRALALWNGDFLDLIPDYANVLRTKLVDVRVCDLSGQGPILVYLFDESDPVHSMMIGWDPASFGDNEPALWESIPAPARTFLRQVHAGYTLGGDWEACGLRRPRDLTTIAEAWQAPDGVPGWFDNWWPDSDPVDSRRMLYVTHSTPDYLLCTSPDVPSGKALTYYDGEINLVDFGAELDKIMLIGVE